MIVLSISGYDVTIDSEDAIPPGNLTVYECRVDYPQVIYTSGPFTGKLLSRVLLDAPMNLVVDHINGNTLDNRLTNLRLCTRQQNQFNRVVAANKESKLPKGVYWSKKDKVFYSQLQYNGVRHNLGSFATLEAAEAAYLRWAAILQGSFAAHISRKEQN